MKKTEENDKQFAAMYENLRTLRRTNGWSMEGLSELSGIDVKILADIEEGKDFGVEDFIQLCRVYRRKPHEMFVCVESPCLE